MGWNGFPKTCFLYQCGHFALFMIMKGRNHRTLVSWKKISWWWMPWTILSVPSYSRWTKLELQENTKNLDSKVFQPLAFLQQTKACLELLLTQGPFCWWPHGSHGKKSPKKAEKNWTKVGFAVPTYVMLSFEFLERNTMGLFRESWLLVGVFFLLPRNTLTLFVIVNQTSTADAGCSNI